MTIPRKKYLLCYLKTGGGHLAPARSIAAYLDKNHADAIEPVLLDGLVEARSFARYIIEDGYRLLQAQAQWYYEFLYATNKFPPIGYFNVAMAKFFIKPYIKKRILEERPSKIVIFHFFLIAPINEILREFNMDIPVITVVTDPYTAHPLWFQSQSQRYVVFSERLKRYCREKRRIPDAHVTLFPFIIDEKFSSPLRIDEIGAIKNRFGMSPEKKQILIIGGGDGIPNGARILQQLLNASLPVEITIVCGKNGQLHADALALQRRYPALKVFAFVDFVYELLNTADIVITKCGASTIMEILLMKKIPVINDYLWEQELGNMEFVRDNRLGIYEPDITKLPAVIDRLISDENEYRSYHDRIESMQLRSGTKEVAEFIYHYTQRDNL
ncbi:MAG: MGDG synthase family glycosyltransferase [Bacteroidota bacterium]